MQIKRFEARNMSEASKTSRKNLALMRDSFRKIIESEKDFNRRVNLPQRLKLRLQPIITLNRKPTQLQGNMRLIAMHKRKTF